MNGREQESSVDELVTAAHQRHTIPWSFDTTPTMLYSTSVDRNFMSFPSAGMPFTAMGAPQSIPPTSNDEPMSHEDRDVWTYHAPAYGRAASRNNNGTMPYPSRVQQQDTRSRNVSMLPIITTTGDGGYPAPSVPIYPQDTTNVYFFYHSGPVTTVQSFQPDNIFGEECFTADLSEGFVLSMGDQFSEQVTYPNLPHAHILDTHRYDRDQSINVPAAVPRGTSQIVKDCLICGKEFKGTYARRNLTRHLESQHVPTVGLNFADDGKKQLYCKAPGCNKGPYHREDSLLKHERHHAELGLMPAIKRKRSDCPQNSTPSFSSPNGNIGGASVPGAPGQQRSAFEGPWLINQ